MNLQLETDYAEAEREYRAALDAYRELRNSLKLRPHQPDPWDSGTNPYKPGTAKHAARESVLARGRAVDQQYTRALDRFGPLQKAMQQLRVEQALAAYQFSSPYQGETDDTRS